MTLYELLNKIQQKPGMYIGVPSLTHLSMFLCGYAFSLQEQGLVLTAAEEEFDRFQFWVQRRFNVNAAVSWSKIILLYSADDRAGFELFFELWNEFLNEQQQGVVVGYEKVVA